MRHAIQNVENERPRAPFRGALPDVRYVRSEFSLRINVQLIFILKYIKERNIVMTTESVRGTRLGKYVRRCYLLLLAKYDYREGILRQPQIAFGRSSPIFTSVAWFLHLENIWSLVRSWKIGEDD